MIDQTALTTALADRYRIGRQLGAGGMASVFLARDLKHDRDVAIKVLLSSVRSSSTSASRRRWVTRARRTRSPWRRVQSSQLPFFNLLGTTAADKKRIVYEGGHFLPRPDMVSESLKWLDHYLGPVAH